MRRYAKTLDSVSREPDEIVEVIPASPAFQVSQLIWWIVGALNALLLLRFLFRLLDADAVSFVASVYQLTDPLIAPFRSITSPGFGVGGVFDLPALVAIIVITVIGGIVTSLLNVARPTRYE